MNDIIFSYDMMLKVLKAQFKDVRQIKGFYRTGILWLIDSRFRTSKSLDKFLKDQIVNPNPVVESIAADLRDEKDIDKTMNNILSFVYNTIRYKSDDLNWGMEEFWPQASEILEKGAEDCDGMNSLIYVLARLAGVPNYVLYSAIGDVNGGGHYWCLYYSTKEDRLVSLDGTYYPDFTKIKDRNSFQLDKSKYQNIWYIFNDYGIWGHQ